MNNVALVGSGGYIASYLQTSLRANPEVDGIVLIDRVEAVNTRLVELQNEASIDALDLSCIDVMIFLAAISSPDICNDEFERCWAVNVVGTTRLIQRAIDAGIKVIFFSSDAVFGEDKGIPFTEDSTTAANTAYGKTKKAVEDTFKPEPLFKAIRLSYVVSKTDKFVRYCLGCMERNETAEVFHPFYRNCITVSVVAKVINWLISNWGVLDTSVLNIAGSELVSRVRIADEVNRLCGKRLKYRVEDPGIDFFTKRSAITQMTSKYLYDLGILPRVSFTDLIKNEFEDK